MRFFLPPNYTKKKKFHKHCIIGVESKMEVSELKYGIAGLQALENGRITPRQMEATRRVISRKLHRMGRILFYIAPEFALTKKPKEIRMGKGKGAVKLWVANVKAGRLLLEIANITDQVLAKEILLSAAKKLPVKTRYISKIVEEI
jgi:large subunit ribosomal protein L16